VVGEEKWGAMTRPSDVPDPRSPDAPIRMDNEKLDRHRSRRSLADYDAIPSRVGEDIPAEPLEIPKIDPVRWLKLQDRRDQILADLRARGGGLLDG
jgi:hypothetical protein